MKKHLLRFLTVLLMACLSVGVLAACGGNGDEGGEGSGSETTYTLTYDVNGGNGTAPQGGSYKEGEKIGLALGAGLTKTDYTFAGWLDGTTVYAAGAEYTMPARNVTLKANWEEAQQPPVDETSLQGVWTGTSTELKVEFEVAIKLVEDNADYIGLAVAGQKATVSGSESATPTTYMGMTVTEVDGKTILGAGTFDAELKLQDGKLTMTLEGRDEQPITVELATHTALPASTPVADGTYYQYSEEGAYIETVIVAQSGKQVTYGEDGYTLEYIGKFAAFMEEGAPKGYVIVTEGSNYTIAAFDDLEELSTTAPVTLTFAAGDHAAEGAIVAEPAKVKPGSTVTLPGEPDAEKGYEFTGWKIGDDTNLKQHGDEVTVSADVTATAQWTETSTPPTPATYTVTYALGDHAADGEEAPAQATATEDNEYKVTLPAAPAAAEGWQFAGWKVGDDTDLKQPQTEITVSADVTVTAQWTETSTPTPTTYTVTYELGDHAAAGEEAPAQATATEANQYKVTLPAAPEAAQGYEFAGWQVGAEVKNAETEITVSENITVTATWNRAYTTDNDVQAQILKWFTAGTLTKTVENGTKVTVEATISGNIADVFFGLLMDVNMNDAWYRLRMDTAAFTVSGNSWRDPYDTKLDSWSATYTSGSIDSYKGMSGAIIVAEAALNNNVLTYTVSVYATTDTEHANAIVVTQHTVTSTTDVTELALNFYYDHADGSAISVTAAKITYPTPITEPAPAATIEGVWTIAEEGMTGTVTIRLVEGQDFAGWVVMDETIGGRRFIVSAKLTAAAEGYTATVTMGDEVTFTFKLDAEGHLVMGTPGEAGTTDNHTLTERNDLPEEITLADTYYAGTEIEINFTDSTFKVGGTAATEVSFVKVGGYIIISGTVSEAPVAISVYKDGDDYYALQFDGEGGSTPIKLTQTKPEPEVTIEGVWTFEENDVTTEVTIKLSENKETAEAIVYIADVSDPGYETYTINYYTLNKTDAGYVYTVSNHGTTVTYTFALQGSSLTMAVSRKMGTSDLGTTTTTFTARTDLPAEAPALTGEYSADAGWTSAVINFDESSMTADRNSYTFTTKTLGKYLIITAVNEDEDEATYFVYEDADNYYLLGGDFEEPTELTQQERAEHTITFNLQDKEAAHHAAGDATTPENITGKEGDLIDLPNDVKTEDGYELVAWREWTSENDSTDHPVGSKFTITADVTLYAVYDAIQYRLTFDKNKPADAAADPTGTIPPMLTVSVEETTVVLPTLSLDGYVFRGWKRNNEGEAMLSFTLTSEIRTALEGKEISFTAAWEKIAEGSFAIKFERGNLDDTVVNTLAGMPANTSHAAGEYTIPAEEPTCEGYTFKGWKVGQDATIYKTGTEHNTYEITDAAVTFTAQWEKVTYTVTYDFGEGTEETRAQEQKAWGTEVDFPAQPAAKEGYKFSGWEAKANSEGSALEGHSANSFTMPMSEVTVYAKWTKIYTVAFSFGEESHAAEGEEVPESVTGKEVGAKVTLTTPKAAEGYEFEGWFTQKGTKVEGTEYTVIASDAEGSTITLTARWKSTEPTPALDINGVWTHEGTTITIKFAENAGGAVVKSGTTYTYFTLTLAEGTYTGTDFTGDKTIKITVSGSDLAVTLPYYTMADTYTRTSALPENLVLEGTYSDDTDSLSIDFTSKQVTMSSEPVDGAQFENLGNYIIIKTEGMTIIVYEDAEKYYAYAGDMGMEIKPATPVPETYTVEFSFGDSHATSELPAQQENKSVGDEIELSDPTAAAGYKFDGWYVKETKVEGSTYTVKAEDAAEGTITITAHWSPITYTVNFYTEKGDEDVAYHTATVTGAEAIGAEGLPEQEPSKKYYRFDGWFLNDETEVDEAYAPSSQSETTLKVYAKWTLVEPELKGNQTPDAENPIKIGKEDNSSGYPDLDGSKADGMEWIGKIEKGNHYTFTGTHSSKATRNTDGLKTYIFSGLKPMAIFRLDNCIDDGLEWNTDWGRGTALMQHENWLLTKYVVPTGAWPGDENFQAAMNGTMTIDIDWVDEEYIKVIFTLASSDASKNFKQLYVIHASADHELQDHYTLAFGAEAAHATFTSFTTTKVAYTEKLFNGPTPSGDQNTFTVGAENCNYGYTGTDLSRAWVGKSFKQGQTITITGTVKSLGTTTWKVPIAYLMSRNENFSVFRTDGWHETAFENYGEFAKVATKEGVTDAEANYFKDGNQTEQSKDTAFMEALKVGDMQFTLTYKWEEAAKITITAKFEKGEVTRETVFTITPAGSKFLTDEYYIGIGGEDIYLQASVVYPEA